jgi:hypothetical protein
VTITFPLDLPFARAFAQASVRPNSVVETNVSPFTAEEQLYAHQGQWWVADMVLPPQKGASAARWKSFLTKLNGREGTFLMGDPGYAGPRGVATGAPLVNGAGQTGLALAVDNFTANITGILLEGDYIGLGSGSTSRMYQVMTDANSNAFGQVTLDIWPRLRYSPADNATVEVVNPRTVWRLTSNEREWQVSPGVIYSMRFGARESL